MTETIDFAHLSLQDALDLAILVEEEAQERYGEFVHQMELHHTPEAAVFFRAMVSNEAKHGAALSARRRELFGDAPRRVRREMLWDVEAPEYDEVRVSMTARQAMAVALRAEEKAYQFFAEALPHVTDGVVHQLFAELRDEESEHQALVREALARMPPDADVDPADYEDEPVAQ
jgi:rubrerythrin